MRYRVNGRQRRLTLGTYPSLGLAKARAAARRRDDERLLNVELLPGLGTCRAKDVTRSEIRQLVEAIAERGVPIVANRTLALVRKVFNFGLDQEFAGLVANPCVRVIPSGVERRRDRVLTSDEMARVWTALDRERAAIAALYRLRLLTARRGGEVLSMRWAEMDLEAGWWTIPADRSKNKLPHRVPLSRPAAEIFTALSRTTSRWVFPSPTAKDQPMQFTAKAMARIRERSGVDFVGHDLRRTAASMMASAGVNRIVIGKILNHAEPGVTAVYDRHSYDAEKRAALETWARTLAAMLQRST